MNQLCRKLHVMPYIIIRESDDGIKRMSALTDNLIQGMAVVTNLNKDRIDGNVFHLVKMEYITGKCEDN